MEHSKPLSRNDDPLTESEPVDYDAVCQKVRAAVEPARPHAISLHDEHGDVLWLSENSMGPDEHNAVLQAIEAFSNAEAPPTFVADLGDSRSALLLRAVNRQRAMVGAIMLVLDSRVVRTDSRGTLKVVTPNLQRALMDFAQMRPQGAPATAAPVQANDLPPLALVEETRPTSDETVLMPKSRPLALVEDKPSTTNGPASTKASSPSTPAAESAALLDATVLMRPKIATQAPSQAPKAPASKLSNAPTTAHLLLSAARTTASSKATSTPKSKNPVEQVTPEMDRLHAAMRRSAIVLHVQRLVPLTKGSQLRRYEVLLRSKSDAAPNTAPQDMLKAAVENGLGSMIDRRVVTELISFLVHHPDVWQSTAVMFSVNLTITALHDEHYIKFVDLCLAKSSLPKGMIAFEVDTATAVKLGDRMVEIATSLNKLGCPLVLDDFSLKTECFSLLRLPGVRYIKLAPEITAKMRSDKLSQAAITGVVQMARVLGMHTVAKHTENAAEQKWLTALGVDFVQSNRMSSAVSINSLSKIKPAPQPESSTQLPAD